MRLRLALLVSVAATAVLGLPHDSAAGDSLASRELEHDAHAKHSRRGLGELGTGAFAGSGASAPRITALQYLLHDWGYSLSADGVWGPATAGAVSAVQPRVGLAADGVPGPATLGGLTKEVTEGSRGNVVRAAQVALDAGLEVDGVFGPGTRAAAEAFQAGKGIKVDGIVGRDTWTALFGGTVATTEQPGTPPEPGTQPESTPPTTETQPETQPTDRPPKTAEPTDRPPKTVETDPGTPRTTQGPGTPAEGTSPLPAAEQNQWQVYAHYAAAGTCAIAKVREGFNCGQHCDWLKARGAHTVKLAVGPSLTISHQNVYAVETGSTLIIVVQGAVPITWRNYVATALENPTLVMDVVKEAKVRKGHTLLTKTISGSLDPVVQASVDGGITRIDLVGHSQGGSIVELLGVKYQLAYPGVAVTVRQFNAPQTGNAAWADVVDSTFPTGRFAYAVRMNDKTSHDPGGEYTHPKGEVFLPVGAAEDGWVQCSGRQNAACSMGVTENLESAEADVHSGPFFGVTMAC